MGIESKLPLMGHVANSSEIETSQGVSCDLTVIEKMEKSLSEELVLQVPFDNKEDTESLSTICDLENNKGNVADAITSSGDTLELWISSKGPDDSLSFGCETPRQSIFDPFAPGPEEAACAPRKKVARGGEVHFRRQLNFDSGDYPVKRLSFDWSDSEDEDKYLQVIHKMILDLFISDGSLNGQEENESCKTPFSKPLLTGIATTCPDAPLRPSLKVLKLSPSICRKIDFDSVSPRSSVVKEDS